MISPYRVEYATYSSLDFDLICDVAFDSDSGATSSFLSREAVASETYRGDRKYVSSYKYTESFAPVITFVDKNFGDFTMERQRQILKWITSKDTPSFINVYRDDSNVVSYAILGNFVSCDSYKLGNGRVVGFQCTFESIMPFALSDLYTITKTITSADDNTITIEIDTDDNKPVYPRITIQENGSVVNIPSTITFSNILDMSDYVENAVYYNGTTYYWKTSEPVFRSDTTVPEYEDWTTVEVTREYTEEDTFEINTFYHYADGGMYYWLDPYSFHSSTTNPNLTTTSVKLTNTWTDFFNQSTVIPSTIVKNNNTTELVTIDGANKIISSNSVRRIFGDDWNLTWLPLHDGKNVITVLGNCKVTLEYRTVIKVGEY